MDAQPNTTPTPAPKVLMTEVASVRSDFYENVDRLFKVWARHDEVEEANIGKAGRYYQYPFGLYERTMERDAHLRSLFNLRVAALLARPWEITPAIDDDGKALEVCEFVREVFDAIGTDDGEEGFEQDRKELQSALPYGFAVFEILWEVREGRYYVRKLMHRHNRRFLFDLDTNAPRLVTEAAPLEGEKLPPYKFIVATFDPSWENPYGFPLCRPSFFNSYLKNEAMKLFAFAIERQACDISVATYDETAEPNLKQQASRLVRSLQRGVGVAKPSSIELEVHALNKTGTAEAMRTFIDECDEANTKLWLGGTLNVDQGDTGSYSLGKVHADHFRQLIESDAKWHAAIWTNQLIRWIVELNFGEQAAAEFCPQMVISLDDEPDTMNLMEIAERAVKMGVRIPTAWFHETFGIPVPEEGEEVIERREAVLPFPPAPQGAQEIPPSPNPQTAKRKQPPPAKLAETADIERPHESAPRLVKMEDAAVLHGDAVYTDLVKQVHDWLDDQGSLNGALENEEDAIRDHTAFLTYLRRVWLAASVAGYRDLLKDLKKRSRGFARSYEKRHKPLRELTTMLSEAETDFLVDGDKPIPVEALRNMEKRTAVDRPTFDAMDARAKANALTAANLSIETIDGRLRTALQNAIAEGMTLDQFKKQMADEPFLSDWHREVVYRTNVQSAYNAGRWELGQDPDVASYFPAAQIAAVMDERTSDICRELNGQLVSRAQLDSGEMVPPFHYACRTVLVYLTADDLQNEIRNGNGWARPDTSPMLEGFGYVDIPGMPDTVAKAATAAPAVAAPLPASKIPPLPSTQAETGNMAEVAAWMNDNKPVMIARIDELIEKRQGSANASYRRILRRTKKNIMGVDKLTEDDVRDILRDVGWSKLRLPMKPIESAGFESLKLQKLREAIKAEAAYEKRMDALEEAFKSAGTPQQQAARFKVQLNKEGYAEITRDAKTPDGKWSRQWGWHSKYQSRYFEVGEGEESVLVRISGHASPPEGGFSQASGERFGAADIQIDPTTGTTWRDALDEAKKLIKERLLEE